MPVVISLGLKETVRKKLQNIRHRLLDFTEPLQEAEVIMQRSIDENFRAQGRPQRWAPWKDPRKVLLGRLYRHRGATYRRLKRGGKGRERMREAVLAKGGMILVDTGTLRASVTGKGEGYIRRLGPTRLVMGTNIKYAATHQYGSPKKNIPARPFLLFQPEDIQRIRQRFQAYIRKVIRGA